MHGNLHSTYSHKCWNIFVQNNMYYNYYNKRSLLLTIFFHYFNDNALYITELLNTKMFN